MKYINKHGIVVVEIVCPDEARKFQNCTCKSARITMGMCYGEWQMSPDAHFRDDNGPMDPKAMLDSAVGDVHFVNNGWTNKRPGRRRKVTGRKWRARVWRCVFFWCMPPAKRNAHRNALWSSGKTWSWGKFAYVFIKSDTATTETVLSAHGLPRPIKRVNFKEPLVEFIPNNSGYILYALTREERAQARKRRQREEQWRMFKLSLTGRLLLL